MEQNDYTNELDFDLSTNDLPTMIRSNVQEFEFQITKNTLELTKIRDQVSGLFDENQRLSNKLSNKQLKDKLKENFLQQEISKQEEQYKLFSQQLAKRQEKTNQRKKEIGLIQNKIYSLKQKGENTVNILNAKIERQKIQTEKLKNKLNISQKEEEINLDFY
ncbi:phospholipase c-beta-2-related [Anaeramoeba flamelloides]|uniref:Phospholipase c-beta-2-related n=1 Tax=Anaeramoeba flamelloides TaxID=1746091 RepID=A0AAV8AFN2_9EUKA|nr:phospholipase c-beta-2-related [Anaeramoeba flamelloides]